MNASEATVIILSSNVAYARDSSLDKTVGIFCNRRMNMHCALHYRIRRLRIHDVQQNVNYFIASDAKNRSTHNVFCFRINRDFDETLCLIFLNGAAHSLIGKFRNGCSAARSPYFGVRHAASP